MGVNDVAVDGAHASLRQVEQVIALGGLAMGDGSTQQPLIAPPNCRTHK